MLHVACFMLYVSCCMLYGVCCMLEIASNNLVTFAILTLKYSFLSLHLFTLSTLTEFLACASLSSSELSAECSRVSHVVCACAGPSLADFHTPQAALLHGVERLTNGVYANHVSYAGVSRADASHTPEW